VGLAQTVPKSVGIEASRKRYDLVRQLRPNDRHHRVAEFDFDYR